MPFVDDLKAGWAELRMQRAIKKSEQRGKAELRRSANSFPWPLALSLACVLIAGAIYAILTLEHLSVAHVDLGDGNYLYTAGRMADGLAIYKDFLSPQPPLHIVTGSLLIRLGRALEKAFDPAGEIPLPLLVVRLFSMTLHLLTMGWMFLLGRRVTQSWAGAALSALLYLLLPITFWWSMGYQSELLEMFWLLGALWFFLFLRPAPMIVAGTGMALGVLTNMTAAPYALACFVYLLVRHGMQGGRTGRMLLLAYLLPLAGILAVVIGWFELRTGAYLENVVFNQMASYPPEGFMAYARGKLLSESMNVIRIETGLLIMALLGLVIYNRTDKRPEREFLVWYVMVLLLSILFVTKGGTMDYIFSVGEPMVALFSASFLTHFFYPTTFRRFFQQPLWRDTSLVPQIVFLLLLTAVVFWPPQRFMSATLRQETYEQNGEDAQRVAFLIRKHSKPDQQILAQPYYAVLAGRRLIEEYSELYLWNIKYMTERQSNQPGAAVRKMLSIEKALQERRIPIVVADDHGRLIRGIPELRAAMDRYYKPLLEPEQRLQTKSFLLQVYLPKTDEELRQQDKP